MSIEQQKEDKKKAGLRIWFTVFIEMDLMILAAILWLNVPDPNNLIVVCVIFAIMIWFPFVTLNSSSRLYIWFDGVMHKINMASLRWYLRLKERPPIRTSKDDDLEEISEYAESYVKKFYPKSGKRKIRYPKQRLSSLQLLIMVGTAGIMQYFVFWILFYEFQTTTLACWIAIIGTTLQLVALIIQFIRKGTDEGPKWFILLTGSTGYFVWCYIFYVYRMISAA